MKHTKISVVLLALLLLACNEETPISPPIIQQEPIAKTVIDEAIISSLQDNDEFNWNEASDEMIWSALIHGDNILTIGYQPAGETNINSRISEIDIRQEAWVTTSDDIITDVVRILERENQEFKEEDLSLRKHEVLPFIDVEVTSLEVVKYLRSLPTVRYVEPLGYEVDFPTVEDGRIESSKGCSNDPNYGIPSNDYTNISPGAKASWHLYANNVVNAWNSSTGSGIGIGLIDTGISPSQDNLNGNFNSGYSSGRYVHKYGFYVSSWWWWASPDGPDDDCGHGTAMAGVMAAPRSTDGSSVGVAYNANLVAVRGTGDVVINGGKEKTGVADALVYLGNRSDVKIISMSIGDVFSNSKVADAVRYAYGRGKLIFAAAGTSTSWTNWYGVIFPASMSETVAVTGIKESGYTRCDVCHSGSKVDFTVIMERSGTENHPLSLAMSGNQPSTVGGSSVATATAAGIAALVWSKNPALSRSQVLDKLKQTADLYPNKSSSFGWGTLDAAAAVNH
ncbi:Subtilase family protein [Ekhidna lutea]|uniref:Subtilase family protein n=1 Tax=Ekhidna lutea TaxID=447679 RepID=A0A239IZA9_EKHLU|nr:S8 family serine peptidase [Ekhidna lutea]SNS98971.1 Subtilase family protein [Ekhidna lutea]